MARNRTLSLARHLQAHPDEPYTLDSLGELAGVSPFHLQRTFKSLLGLTPKQFIDAARLRRFKQELRNSPTVLGAVYAAGFGAPSRLYERADAQLGMTPTEYRDHGSGVSISHVTFSTGFGPLLLGATDRGLCFVQFGESRAELEQALADEYPFASLTRVAEPWPEQLHAWADALQAYLAGQSDSLRLPLDLRATAFQIMVWRYLQTIPRGETRSYKQVAEAIGRPSAARAVARACAGNRVAIVIPCHRVIRGGGALGGYRWGLARKEKLLEMERTG